MYCGREQFLIRLNETSRQENGNTALKEVNRMVNGLL